MGNSLGRAPLGGSDIVRNVYSCWHGLSGQITSRRMRRKIAPKTCQAVCKHWAIASLAGSKTIRAKLLERVSQEKLPQCNCAEKLWAQDLSSGVQRLGDGTCIASLAGSGTKNAQLLARFFQDKYHQSNCAEKIYAQDLSKFPNPDPWDMHGGRRGSRGK